MCIHIYIVHIPSSNSPNMDLKLLGQLQQLGEVVESETDHHAYPPMCKANSDNVLLNMKGDNTVQQLAMRIDVMDRDWKQLRGR